MRSPRSQTPALAAIGLFALIAGLLSSDAVIGVAVAFGLYAARQHWLAARLARVLRDKAPDEPRFAGAIWHDLFASVRRLQARSRNRKQRMNRFVSRFREAAAALPDAVVILDRANRVEWRNPAADALLGLSRADGIGTSIAAHVRDPVFDEYLAGGDFSRPLRIPAPRDRAVVLSLFITRFGRRRQQLLVARDITRAFHLDEARRDFVANVSHELRTPLTVLSGNLEILAETESDAEQSRAALQDMRGNVDRMRQLVDELLELSRLEMNADAQPDERVDVPALLDAIVRDARVLAGRSGHRLELEAQPGLRLHGSASALRSAFSNLVHNGIRHTPPRTRITLRWYADEAGAHLVVSDNGPGIAPRHIPRLAERFYRVDPSRSTRSGGTGLGLSIVKHALERHGAALSVSSKVGEGSSFGCHFPPSRLEAESPGTIAPPDDATPIEDLD